MDKLEAAKLEGFDFAADKDEPAEDTVKDEPSEEVETKGSEALQAEPHESQTQQQDTRLDDARGALQYAKSITHSSDETAEVIFGKFVASELQKMSSKICQETKAKIIAAITEGIKKQSILNHKTVSQGRDVKVKEEKFEESSGDDISDMEQGLDVEGKEEKFEDSFEDDISDTEQVPEIGHPLELLQIEIKEDDALGPEEKALNSTELLQSASGGWTTTPKEVLINPNSFHNVDSLQPSQYICKLCGEIFPNAIRLTKHCLNNRKEPCVPAEVQTFKNKAEDCWFCEFCQKQFKSEQLLTAHMSGHVPAIEKTASSVSDEFDTEDDGHNHVKLHPYSCEVCGKSFSEASRLVRHAESHSGAHLHKCNVCGKFFRQLCNLKRHKLTHTGEQPSNIKQHKLTHTEEQPYICDVCGRSYCRSDLLDSHKCTHTQELPYCCEFCGKGFKYPYSLKRHKRIHTEERPYSCDFCGRNFAKSYQLEEHRVIHAKKKVYKCDDCGRTFTEKRDLTLVRRNGVRKRSCEACRKQSGKYRRRRCAVDVPLPTFDCEVCGKSFDRPSGLERHKRLHTGERPFSCEHCGKGFTQPRGVKCHICPLMQGLPPYVCQICGKCFDVLSNLNKHISRKHKIK